VVFEEFQSDNFRQNFYQIKKLLEGRRFGIDIKYKNSRSIIFVSKLSPVDLEGSAGEEEAIATLCDDKDDRWCDFCTRPLFINYAHKS